MATPLFDGLNESQRRAVELIDGPVLALAGPGSGKTRVLTHRIAYMIHHKQIAPTQILAVTFTNEAAREMRERMVQLIGADQASRVDIGTFHSLAARWLRRDGRMVGLADGWVIYDDDDQQRLIKRVMKELHLPERTLSPRALASAISDAKNNMHGPQSYATVARTPEQRMIARCFDRYEALLHQSNAVDFDDLLIRAIALLNSPAVHRFHARYQYVLVDEYQDTNRAQYEIVKHLARGSNNLFVVGDDDQAIYGWRGADVRNIRRFDRDFPNAHIVILAENYRSTAAILQVAQALIDGATERPHRKELRATHLGGDPVVWREHTDQNDEAQRVCDAIVRLVQSGQAQYRDCAIMYRTNAQSRPFEEALGRRQIPYVLVGGMRFYERREIKDMLAWLRVVANPHDDVSLLRAINFPASGIGDASQEHVTAWATTQQCSWYTALCDAARDVNAIPALKGSARQRILLFGGRLQRLIDSAPHQSLVTTFAAILAETQFFAALQQAHGETDGESRAENVIELQRVAAEYDELPMPEQLTRFLEEIALVADVDTLKSDNNHVVCITMHQAKGLEYDHVFLVGLEDEILPHRRTHESQHEIEEERRILYVGVTRARKTLTLSRARRRATFGRYDTTTISRFVAPIISKHLTMSPAPVNPNRSSTSNPAYQGWGTAATFQRTPTTSSATDAVQQWQVGDHVRHQRFGEGIILEAKVVDDDVEVVVRFADKALGEKRLIASFARLERLTRDSE